MAARDAYDSQDYDQERVVNQVHEDIAADGVVHETVAEPQRRVVSMSGRAARRGAIVDHDAPTAAYDTVVREEPQRVAYVSETPYVADDVREDVTIDRVVARRAVLDRVSSLVWFFTGLLEATLALRIVFQLLNANRSSGFVSFIYGFTEPFTRPFQNIFNNPTSGNAVLDSGAVVALIIYALVAWAIVRLIWLAFDRPESGRSRAVSHVQRDHI
jgi:hypothetical protein